MTTRANHVYGIVAALLFLLAVWVLKAKYGATEAPLPPAVKAAQARLHDAPTAENYDALSFQFYRARMPERSVAASLEAVRLNPSVASYFNNLCAAYNDLGNYSQAIAACQNALRIDPGYQLARNNLNFALGHSKKQ